MMYELIRSFAYENFGSDYHVAPQGHNSTIQPLALIVKENLSCWRRATRRPKKIVLEGLDAYLTDDAENVRSNVAPMIEGELQKDKILTVSNVTSTTTSRNVDLELGDELIVGHGNRNTVLGELNLSSVQEEYYKDMSLRNILSNAKLDPTKMEPYEKNKLYIITGVVYSDKMQISGEREENDAIGGQVKFLPRVHWLSRLTKLKANMSWTEIPAPPVERNERSPLLFTFAKVKYNQENRCLELQQIVGAKLKRKTTLDVVADSVADSLFFGEPEMIMVTTKEQWIYEDLMEISETKTEKKLRVVTNFIGETESLKEMILRARKYKSLIDRVSRTEKMAIRLESPLSSNDSYLLQTIGVEIEYHKLNNSKTLRISAHNRAMVLDFAVIFYHLQEIQEDEWRLLKKFCLYPIDMEDGKCKNDSNEDDEAMEQKEVEKYSENGRMIKEDILGNEEPLIKECVRKGFKEKDENDEGKENISKEKRLFGEGTWVGIKIENNKDDNDKEEDIHQDQHLVQEDVPQDKHLDQEDVHQDEHFVQEDVHQDEHLVHEDVDQDEHLVQEDVPQDKHLVQEDVPQDKHLDQEDVHQDQHLVQEDVPQDKHLVQEDVPQDKHLDQEDVHQDDHFAQENIHQDQHLVPENIPQDKHLDQEDVHQDDHFAQENIHQDQHLVQEDVPQDKHLDQEDFHQDEHLDQDKHLVQENGHQDEHLVQEDVDQDEHLVHEDVDQDEHLVQEDIHQDERLVQKDIHQDKHLAHDDIHQDKRLVQEDIHQDKHLAQDDIHQDKHLVQEDIHQDKHLVQEDMTNDVKTEIKDTHEKE